MKLLYGLLLCSFLVNSATNDFLPYAKSFAAGYATVYATAYAHNLGHAFVAKTVFNTPSTITVPVLALWKSKISHKAILPSHGLKTAMYDIAGSVFGLAIMYASLKLNSMVSQYSSDKSLVQTFKDGYNKPLIHKEQDKGIQVAVVAGVCSELAHLIPLKIFNNGHGNDGYQFLKALKFI